MDTISSCAITCAPCMETPWIPFDAAIMLAETCKKKIDEVTPMHAIQSNIGGTTGIMFAWRILLAAHDSSRHWLQCHSDVSAHFQQPPIYREDNNPPRDSRREHKIDRCSRKNLATRNEELMTPFVSISVRSTILLVVENNPPENCAMANPKCALCVLKFARAFTRSSISSLSQRT